MYHSNTSFLVDLNMSIVVKYFYRFILQLRKLHIDKFWKILICDLIKKLLFSTRALLSKFKELVSFNFHYLQKLKVIPTKSFYWIFQTMQCPKRNCYVLTKNKTNKKTHTNNKRTPPPNKKITSNAFFKLSWSSFFLCLLHVNGNIYKD